MTPTQFRQTRQSANMTIKDCAAYLRITSRAVSYYESGARKIPGPVVALMEQLQR